MARAHQSRRGEGTRVRAPRRSSPGRPVRLPIARERRYPYEDLRKKVLRAAGIFLLCVLVATIGLAAGGYLGLVRSVDQLGKPQNPETHPTYIYSAPLGRKDDSRRIIGTVLQGENRKVASK